MTSQKSNPVSLRDSAYVGGLAVVVLLAFLFGATFYDLVGMWSFDPSYSHGFLILPLSAGIAIWIYRKKAGAPRKGEILLGSGAIIAGCVVHCLGLVVRWPLVEFAAIALVLRGIAVTLGGRKWANQFLFPTAFLFFMFPLPVVWTSQLAVWLQDVVARGSGAILNLFVVCYQRGNMLIIAGSGPLHVAEQCSGLRQTIAFLALGFLVCFFVSQFVRLPWLLAIVLVVAAVPVAIAANVLRVVLMAVGVRYFGSDWLDGWMHDIPALMTLPVGLALYLLVGWSIWRMCPKENVAVAPTTANVEEKDSDVAK